MASIVAFLLSAGSMPLAKRTARRFGITATPWSPEGFGTRTPVMGGVPIVGAIVLTLLALGDLPAWLACSSIVLLAIGVIDDRFVLNPRQKLFTEIVVATAVVLILPRGAAYTPWPLIDTLAVIFWLVAATNAYNLVDGLDGLAAGVGIVASLAIAIAAWLQGATALSLQALVISASLAGFLVYNFHPASIFMGDGGALPIGLMLGALAIQVGSLPANSRLTKYVVPALIMLVPLVDTTIVTVTRIATGRGISRRGLDHSHHRLLQLGLSQRATAVIGWCFAAIGAGCAVAASVLPHAYLLSALPFIAAIVGVIVLFMMDITFDSYPPGIAYGSVRGLARFALSLGYRRRLVEVALDGVLIAGAVFGAFLIRQDFKIDDTQTLAILALLPWIWGCTYAGFLFAGVYRGMWRYAGLSDSVRFAMGALLAGVLIMMASPLMGSKMPFATALLYVIVVFNLLAGSRLSFRLIRKGLARLALPNARVLVVGAGRIGAAAAQYLSSEHSETRHLVGFVDDDEFKIGKLVQGAEVLGSIEDLDRIYAANRFDVILIAAPSLREERRELVRLFSDKRSIRVHNFSITLEEIEEQHPSARIRSAAGSTQIATTERAV